MANKSKALRARQPTPVTVTTSPTVAARAEDDAASERWERGSARGRGVSQLQAPPDPLNAAIHRVQPALHGREIDLQFGDP